MATASYTRRFTKNAIIVVVSRVWSIGQWILVTPFVLHHLGSDRFGVWSLLFLLSGYLATFDLGLGASVVKYTAQHASTGAWDDLRATVAQISRLYVLLAVVWVLAVAVGNAWILDWLHVAPAHREEVRFAILASAAIFALANLVSVGIGILNGLQRMDLANGIMAGASIPQLIVLLVGLERGFGLYAVVAATALNWLLIAALTIVAVRRVAPGAGWPGWRVRGRSGDWFRYSSVMQIVNIVHLSQQQIDKIVLTTWIGLSAVTQFELGFRVANGVQSLPVVMLSPLVPALADLHGRGDLERLKRVCRRGTDLVFAGAAVVAACGIPAAPLAVRAWVGDGYPEAAALAPWMMAAFAINLTTGMGTSTVRGAGRPGLELAPALLALAVHLAASSVLVPRLGAVGAGPALLLAMIVWAGLFLVRFAHWLGEPVRRMVVSPLARGLIAFAPAWVAGSWLAARWPAAWQTGRLSLLAGAAVSAGAAAVLVAAAWWITSRIGWRAPEPATEGV